MRLEIFDDDSYFNKLDEFITIDRVSSIFPFKEMFIDPDNLISEYGDFTDIYNFLKEVHFLYYYSQRYIGYTLLDNKYYIVFVDDEINVRIVGDNEINWTITVLEDDDYLQFKKFCIENYGITYKDPDYDELLDVLIKHANF